MGRIPPPIDLIEILYAMGEMTMREVHVQVPDSREAWNAIGYLVNDKIAALWVTEGGAARRLIDWEVLALLRNRLSESGETAPPDEALVLRAAEKIEDAYHCDFGAWYEREQRARKGACLRCGYDRRGLAPDAKCPECGTVPH